ncbi:MAG: hypothetical protein DMG30_23050 [Acidobacteria bacterium]|nr:MAG: hypothetical protein DMG30_23050 [Acidobacteriota bacterium]
MARTAALPAPWWRGEPISFEFHDAKGRLIRSRSVNRGHPPVAGAYIPAFHNPQDRENCAPACALNYELVLPRSLRFPVRPKPGLNPVSRVIHGNWLFDVGNSGRRGAAIASAGPAHTPRLSLGLPNRRRGMYS